MKSRKTNKAKRLDGSCRNNGTCPWCRRGRLHTSERDTQDSVRELVAEADRAVSRAIALIEPIDESEIADGEHQEISGPVGLRQQ